MGLKERRAAADFQEKLFPKYCKDVRDAAGFEVPIEVNWEQLAVNEYAHLYDEAFAKVYFQPLTAAFKAITADKMGKEALQKSLKKIMIVNSDKYYSSTGFKFESGTLTLDHQPCSNVDDVAERSRELQKMLENAI